jgi:hypothetical protein
VADVNSDGRVDLVGQVPYAIWVSYQDSKGKFTPETSVGPACIGGPPNDGTWGFIAADAGDVTGDGRADVICATMTDSPGAAIDVFREINGHLTNRPALYPAADLPWKTMIGDVNQDGRNGVIVLHRSVNIGLYTQQSNGTLGPEQIIDTSLVMPSLAPADSPALADLDGNGRPDIVISGDNGIAIAYQH